MYRVKRRVGVAAPSTLPLLRKPPSVKSADASSSFGPLPSRRLFLISASAWESTSRFLAAASFARSTASSASSSAMAPSCSPMPASASARVRRASTKAGSACTAAR